MTLHAQHATSGHALRELRQTEPHAVLSSGTLGPLVTELIAAQAENDRQRLLVFNPSREIDSLSELLMSLLRPGTDRDATIAEATAKLRELLESNHRERLHEQAATGPLDTLTTVLHVQGRRSGLSIRDAAKRLRDPLKVVGRARTEVVPFREYFIACCQIKDVIGELGTEALRGSSLHNQLGDDPHDVLLSLLTDGEQTAASQEHAPASTGEQAS